MNAVISLSAALILLIVSCGIEQSSTELNIYLNEDENVYSNTNERHHETNSIDITAESDVKNNETTVETQDHEIKPLIQFDNLSSVRIEFPDTHFTRKSHGNFNSRKKIKSFPFLGHQSEISRDIGLGKSSNKRTIPIKEHSAEEALVIILYSGIIITALLRNFLLTLRYPLDNQAPIILYGIFTGLVYRYVSVEYSKPEMLSYLNYLLIYLLVPTMAYRACIATDLHRLKENLVRSFIISVPCLITNALIVGVIMCYLMKMQWNFVSYMFFGTACVFIYPKQIIDIMKEEDSQSQQIALLLEGELILGTMFVFALHILWFEGPVIAATTYEILVNIPRYLGGVFIGMVSAVLNYYVFWLFSSDVIHVYLFTTIFPLFVYYLCYDFLLSAGIVAVVICGLTLATDRIVLSKRSEAIIKNFSKFFHTLVYSTVVTGLGLEIACEYVWYSTFKDYVFIVLLYCITYFGRFIVFTLLDILSKKVAFHMDLRCRILAVCGGVPSLINIAYTILPTSLEDVTKVKPIAFFYLSGMVIISLLLNVTSLPYLISFLKLDVISSSRENEVEISVNYLRNLKSREMMFLKLESLMGETDWVMVRTISKLSNPFRKESESDVEEREQVDQSIKFCPDCHSELTIPMNYAEYPKQKETTNLRLLKAREALQYLMFTKRLFSRKSFIILSDILKEAYSHPNNCLKADNLVKKFDVELACAERCQKSYQSCHSFLFKPTEIRPPNIYCTRLCYHLIENKIFIMATAAVIFVNMIFIIAEGCINPKPPSDMKYVFTFFDFVFLIFFTSEWLINIGARSRIRFWKNGFMDYLRSPFNIFDFVILITLWTSFTIEASLYSNLSTEMFIYFHRPWFTAFKSVRVLRLIRYQNYALSFVTKIRHYYERQNLLTSYDIGKDFFIQETSIMRILQSICPNNRICRDLEEDIDHALQEVIRELHNVESKFPRISTTVKTRHATKLVINSMRDTVDHLFVSGWIDCPEHNSLIYLLNNMVSAVERKGRIEPVSKEKVFESVSWMQNYPKTKNALLEKAQTKRFDAGKPIILEGEKSNGIYIIIAGVCDISYIPQEDTLSKLHNYGELPVVDNILSGYFENRINSYLTSSMTIGELSFLTDRPYASNVTADSPCEACFLSSDVLHEVMQIDCDPDNGLECRIWKNISKNMATALLLSLIKHNFDEIMLHHRFFRKFYVPKINQSENFDVHISIKDIVLIEGVIEDTVDEKRYTAPCKIPRHVRNIAFPQNNVVAKLLFIPREESDTSRLSFQKPKGQK